MTIKVIACDMDGTLLDDKGHYDRERFERVFQALKEKDIRFVVASGNNMGRLAMIFDGMVEELSYVAENGGHILENGVELVHHSLDKADVEAFLAYFAGKHRDYRVLVSTADRAYALEGTSFNQSYDMIDPVQLKTFLDRIVFIKDWTDLPTDQPLLKVTMALPEEDCEAIMADFNRHFTGNLTAVTSGYGAVDVIATGIHKAWGLKQLLERWQVSAEELMAFGDGGNDIEMLALAKYSYAMANAPEKVKEAANFLAPSHTENGVLRIIEEVVLGQ